MIIWFSAPTPPKGFIECNGQSTKLYPKLALIVGENVPDLRGTFIRGYDHGKGIDKGRDFGSFESDSIKSHSHQIDGIWQFGNGIENGAYGQFVGGAYPVRGNHGIYGDLLDDSYLNSSRSYGDIETRPKNISLLPCIKY